jgi:predicted nuclease with TOPRIM domain
MALTLKNPAQTQTPAQTQVPAESVPDTKKIKEKVNQLKEDKKQVDELTKGIEHSISDINKKWEETFEKSAKLICLLRLDMVADKLESINTKMASQIDTVANDLEKAEWE